MDIVYLEEQEIDMACPYFNDGELSDSEIVITVNEETLTSSCFSFMDEGIQPAVLSMEPISANPNLKSQLTITGEHFNTESETVVSLIRETDEKLC